jgi:predicted RNase H-like HicB family nuclease
MLQVTAILTHAEKGGFVALNPEPETVPQGAALNEAIPNLRKAVDLYLEVFPDMIDSHVAI